MRALALVASWGLGLGSLALVGCSSAAAADGTEDTNAAETASSETTAAKAAGADASAPNATTASACSTSNRFSVQGDLTVDSQTGLAWQRSVDQTRRTQANAAEYCASQGLQLPTSAQLNTLKLSPILIGGDTRATAKACIPSIDQVAFPNTPIDDFWTATTTPQGEALYVGFDDGRTRPDDPTDTLLVRCVKD